MNKIIIPIIAIIILFSFHFASAESVLEVDYPEIEGIEVGEGLTSFLRYIYIYGLATIGILTLLALMIGGIMYMTAGSITSAEEAKKWIWGALGGLLLGLSAFLILNTINPDLVNLREPKLGIWIKTTSCADTDMISIDESMCSGEKPDSDYQCCGIKFTEITESLPKEGQNCDKIDNPCGSGLSCQKEKCVAGKINDPCDEVGEQSNCQEGLICVNANSPYPFPHCEGAPARGEGDSCAEASSGSKNHTIRQSNCNDGLVCIKTGDDNRCFDGNEGDPCTSKRKGAGKFDQGTCQNKLLCSGAVSGVCFKP